MSEQLGIFGGSDLSEPQDRDRWCTPPWLLALVREALGEIDLDPASNARAQALVQATAWYSLDVGRDGLALPWIGRVWCNPPYARGLIVEWADKILAEWRRGEVDAMIVLVNSSTSASWWQALAGAAEAIIYPDRRLAFWHAETGRTQSGNSYDQTLFVFGLVDLDCLKDVGLICSKAAPLSEQIPPILAGDPDTWSDVSLADEMCGRSWARLSDITEGWEGWREGYYDPDTQPRGQRDEQARGVADLLTQACEIVEVLWHQAQPTKPTDRHLLMWDLITRADARLSTMETQWRALTL